MTLDQDFAAICAVIPDIEGRASAGTIKDLIRTMPDVDWAFHAQDCRDYWDGQDAKKPKGRKVWHQRFIKNMDSRRYLRLKSGKLVPRGQYQPRTLTVVRPPSGSDSWDVARSILEDEDNQRRFAYEELGVATTYERAYARLLVLTETATDITLAAPSVESLNAVHSAWEKFIAAFRVSGCDKALHVVVEAA